MPAYDTGCADVLFAHGPVITALLWFGPAAMGTATHRRRSGDQPDHHGGTQPCTQLTDAQPHDPSAASGDQRPGQTDAEKGRRRVIFATNGAKIDCATASPITAEPRKPCRAERFAP